MRVIRILILVLSVVSGLFSQNDVLINAKKEYSKGNFAKSIELYDSLVESKQYSPELYYNLGNSYFKQGEFGKAILNYEKALKYKPNDNDIKHNIFLAKRKIDSEIVELPDFFLNRWWIGVTNLFSLGIWTALSFLSALLLVIVFGFYWFKDYSFSGWFSLYVFVLILFLTVSIFASFRKEKIIYKSDKCILIKSDSLFNAPDSRSELLYKLEPGEKFQLIDSINNWYKVKLLNKETGWIDKSNCEKI